MMRFPGLAILLSAALVPAAANAQAGFFPNNVVPNPVRYGEPAQFHFIVPADGCLYDYARPTFGVAGNTLTLTYDIVPRVPPVCFTIPPPIGVRVNLMPLPPGDYVIRAQGYLGGQPVQPVVASFRVLGVTSESVPTLSRWALAVLGLLVLGIALVGCARNRGDSFGV